MLFSNHVATALQQRLLFEHLHTVNEILATSVSSHDIDKLLCQAVRQISKAFGYKVDICMLEQQQEQPYLVYKATVLYNARLETNLLTLPLCKGITGRVASSGKAAVVFDVTQDPDYYPGSLETKSELAVPLFHAGKIVGVLNVESKEYGAFTQDHLRIFEAVAASITLALENTRHLQERNALRKISAMVSRAQNVEQILEETITTVLDLFSANACGLYLVDPDGEHLTRVSHQGLPHTLVERARRLRKGVSTAGKVLESGKPMMIWDIVHDESVDGMVKDDENLQSLMAVPVKTDKGIWEF